MTPEHVQFIGLTRWSYPFWSAGFNRSSETLEGLRASLYAPHRLDHRLFLFENLVLPSLRGQTDKDFTHLLLIGDQLPDPWRGRILKLVADVPQIKPISRPEGLGHRTLCRSLIQEHIDPNAEVTAQYRLDDDDAVGLNFIKRSRALFPDLYPFFTQENRMALDFTHGFMLQSDLEEIDIKPISMRLWAPGMTVFQRADSREALLDYPHLRIWNYMPVLTWRKEPMFIRGAHHDNDSDISPVGRRTRSFKFQNRTPQRYFERRFGLDLNKVKKIWDAEKSHFIGAPAQAAE